jgi:Zn-dependent peptidase ImmA (M78 family)
MKKMKENDLDIVVDEIANACEKKSPINIESIIRSYGILLDRKAELHRDIAGQIELMSDGNTYKISTNKQDGYYRQRFTMAHELGHFLFHSSLLGEGVDDNKAYRSSREKST